ncbi:hypothetical protein V8B97DRAFT_654844 [Scleroderma yunnanense]
MYRVSRAYDAFFYPGYGPLPPFFWVIRDDYDYHIFSLLTTDVEVTGSLVRYLVDHVDCCEDGRQFDSSRWPAELYYVLSWAWYPMLFCSVSIPIHPICNVCVEHYEYAKCMPYIVSAP